MRATTAAAAAVLLGSVSADWESWSGSSTDVDSKTPVLDTTYSKPTDPATYDTEDKTWTATPSATTDSSDNWGTWSTTTSSSADPTTWSEWSSTSSTPDAKTSTSTDPDYTWSEWSTSSSSADPSTWSEWTSTTSADPSTTWAAWSSSSSADPTTSWSAWSSAGKSSDPSTTWSEWDPTATVTSTSTQWITVTVYPVDGGNTWSEWSSDGATTTTNTNTVVVSSTVTKTGTWADWSASASATPVAAFDPQCKLQVSVSYGAPVWYPTPVIATSANSTAWGEWDGASSSTPDASTSSDYTWAVWTAASSSDSATSTDPSSWSAWDGASSTSDSATSTSASSSWGAWDGSSSPAASTSTAAASSWTNWGSSASQTQGGAFYSASATGSWGSKSSGSWSTGANGISSNGNKFGMTYSPYISSGGCKDQGTVSADIAEIAAKGFTSVRVYSTDCSTLEFVGGAAKSNGMKVILGVFISDTGISGAQPQVDAIAAWAQWDLVELIVVGNEAVFNARCSASDLAGFISSSKQAFQAAGYKGAISTTDELSVWQGQGSAWCDVVDVVSANLYAFFNPNTAAEDAGSFIQNQIQDLSSVCPGKEVYVMESGWPSAGECNGMACPSPENQATAIKGIQSTSGAKVVFFSFEDEQWKQPGQFGVEQHWGCGSVFN